jgi:hypothetical protein
LLLKNEINNYYSELFEKTGNPIEVVCNHDGHSIIANYIKDENNQWISID